MPDVLSVGIGGGSRVRDGADLTVGPDSVGYRLTREALVFGGDTLTATDLAVAGGLCDLGDPDRVLHLEARLVREGVLQIQERVAELIDRVKTSPEPVPVVVVGGGSVLLKEELAGASRVLKPDHFAVANAIGAAIAQVGGETDKVFSLADVPRASALEAAQREAVEKAVAAGADESTVQIVDVEEVPLAYLPSNAVRIRVKAVGELGALDAAARA
jgi:N-methylhydantoinase A/oxoprolinase/acetone carboxylase beta subunit